jgi:hypothetical protein
MKATRPGSSLLSAMCLVLLVIILIFLSFGFLFSKMGVTIAIPLGCCKDPKKLQKRSGFANCSEQQGEEEASPFQCDY